MNEGWGQRLRAARRAYEERHDTRLSYAEIGRRVGAVLGRDGYSVPSTRAWFMEGQEPDSFVVVVALARVLEADPAALAFPKECPAAATTYGGRVSNADAEAASRERAAKLAPAAAPAKKAAGGKPSRANPRGGR